MGLTPEWVPLMFCPLIPVSGISMEETADYAHKLAGRIGKELAIPVYCYENAAFEEKRRNLASCRAGEYEGLEKKLAVPEWKPDFGPAKMNVRSGATAVGARDFLVAFNVNLNTTSTRKANSVAFDVREKGRTITNEKGEMETIPGSLKSVKAIGWYIEEYGIAQISMNLTNISVTPVHIAFDEVCRKAEARGLRVTGSELVGLIPLKAILDAGRYFLEKQERSTGVPDKELIKIAVRSMGLNDIHPFNPEEKIIEFVMAEKGKRKLAGMDLRAFMEETCFRITGSRRRICISLYGSPGCSTRDNGRKPFKPQERLGRQVEGILPTGLKRARLFRIHCLIWLMKILKLSTG